MQLTRLAVLLSGLTLAHLAYSNEAGDIPIAGVNPEQRLPNAPVMSEYNKDNEWYKHALRGIEQPYPDSVRLKLLDQANWYTPFIHPGMNGRYDIRGLHQEE